MTVPLYSDDSAIARVICFRFCGWRHVFI